MLLYWAQSSSQLIFCYNKSNNKLNSKKSTQKKKKKKKNLFLNPYVYVSCDFTI